MREGVEPPDLLLDRFDGLGTACAAPLEALARDEGEGADVRAQALGLLPGIDEARAVPVSIDAVLAAQESDSFCEMAAELLAGRVDANCASVLLSGYDAAPAFARKLILEVLSNFPGDARVYGHMLDMLKNCPEERAFAARLLGRYGDERAVGPLKALLAATGHQLLRIHGIAQRRGSPRRRGSFREREFYGDPDYEYLRELE